MKALTLLAAVSIGDIDPQYGAGTQQVHKKAPIIFSGGPGSPAIFVPDNR